MESVTPYELRALMERHNWSQAELADAMDVAQFSVMRWLNGERPMSKIYARRFRDLEAADRMDQPIQAPAPGR